MAQTTDAQLSFFYRNPKLLGLDRQFGQINLGGIFGPFGGTVSPLSIFSINQALFLQKTKHLYQIFI